MEFFDKNSEVVDIQLTKLGKERLAAGLFKPAFYFFSDDDVLYDNGYGPGASGSEEQNSILPRIGLVPRFKSLPSQTEMAILGDSDSNSIYAPSWSLKALRGEIGEVKFSLEDDKSEFPMAVQKVRVDMVPATSSINQVGSTDPAGYLLEITEKNVSERPDMYEVEVSLYHASESDEEQSKFETLMFVDTSKSEVIDDILVEFSDIVYRVEYDNVEKYFDVSVDAKAVEYKPSVVLFADSMREREAYATALYSSRTIDENIEEKC